MKDTKMKIVEWRACYPSRNFPLCLLLILLFFILCIGQEETIQQSELTEQPQEEATHFDNCLISLGTKEGSSFSIEALDASGISYEYIVPEAYQRGEDKEPASGTIRALVYDYDENTRIYLGYHQPWFYIESDTELTPKTVCDELRRLVILGVFVGLTEDDLNAIEGALNTVELWEFGIEIGYTKNGWQQVFPKSEVNPVKGTRRIKR